MAKVVLDDLLNLPDPFMSDNWNLQITAPPGAALTSDLRIQCKSVSLPGITNEAQEVNIHGYKLAFAGRTIFPGTLSISFIETNQLIIYRQLVRWVRAARDHRTQFSDKGKKDGYVAKGAILEVYDEMGRAAGITGISFKNFWCAEVADISLDNSSPAPVEVSATFRYDSYDAESF